MGMKPWCVYHSYGAQALIPAADRGRIALILLGFMCRAAWHGSRSSPHQLDLPANSHQQEHPCL